MPIKQSKKRMKNLISRSLGLHVSFAVIDGQRVGAARPDTTSGQHGAIVVGLLGLTGCAVAGFVLGLRSRHGPMGFFRVVPAREARPTLRVVPAHSSQC